MVFVKLLGRVWIPLVILLVLGCGAFIVARVHDVSGADNRPSYDDTHAAGAGSFAPKQVVYEVSGPAGAVADISYFDVNSQPQQLDAVSLPWSLTMSVNSPAVVANVVAQGDSDTIGCRIVIDGEVKAERVTNAVNAYTYCMVKGA